MTGIPWKGDTMATTLLFSDLRAANAARSIAWSGGQSLGVEFSAIELGGECGELLNEIKKLLRARRGMVGGSTSTDAIASELADVVICADLLAAELGINLGHAVIEKFNQTSRKYGFSHHLGGE